MMRTRKKNTPNFAQHRLSLLKRHTVNNRFFFWYKKQQRQQEGTYIEGEESLECDKPQSRRNLSLQLLEKREIEEVMKPLQRT